MDRHQAGVRLFLGAALISFLLSIALWFTDNRDEGRLRRPVGAVDPRRRRLGMRRVEVSERSERVHTNR